MLRYILTRLGQALLVLLLVTIMVFVAMHAMPGDPIKMRLGDAATPEQIAFYTQEFGLDKPVYIQYVKWIGGLFRGQMGRSITFSTDVSELLFKRVGVTLTVTLPALFLAILIGVTLGCLAATHRGKKLDSLISVVANFGIATPSFWVGILLVFLFSIALGWLPVQGFTPPSEDLGKSVRQLIMPVIVLSLGPMASYARQTRSAMLEVIRQDYVRTARSKGLKEKTVIVRHALHNALIPIITLMGMSLSHVIGGSVLVERLFVIPGVGSLMMTAITNMDYMVVLNGVLVITACILTCNLAVDILYGIVDPRIRVDG